MTRNERAAFAEKLTRLSFVEKELAASSEEALLLAHKLDTARGEKEIALHDQKKKEQGYHK